MKGPVQLDQNIIKKVSDLRNEIISALLEFIDYCYVDTKSKSKYGIMGPAGKLLNLCKVAGEIDWGQIKGYILNVVRMSGLYSVPIEAVKLIDNVVDDLAEVRRQIKGMEWLNFIDGVDYELFFQIFKSNKDSMVEYIKNKFGEYLKEKLKDFTKISEVLKMTILKDEDIPHPSNIQNKDIAKEFWEYYNKSKGKKGVN